MPLLRIALVAGLLALSALPAVLPAAQQARWEELNARVQDLYRQGKYAEATSVAQEALRVAEITFGPEDPDVAISLNNLAMLYQDQGKYAEAEPLYERALRIWAKALGPDHPDVALSLNNLAMLYKDQGKYAEAEPLCQRALGIKEKALGAEHPDLARSLNNLAELYRAQGKYAEAEPLHQRALRIREKALGLDHPDVANSLNNLAELYRAQGKYAEAERLYQRALGIEEKALGAEHPDVAVSLNNVALLYHTQGKYAEAEPLCQRALRIWEKALGPEHPDVARSLNNLAGLYDKQGKYAEAEPLHQRALRIWEKALGPEHPDVAASLSNLAGLYDKQGKYAEAEPLYQRALRIFEKALGPAHPDVATALNNLALLYETQGKYAEAEPLHQRALRIREKALGPEHPDVANSLNNLAELYRAQGKYAIAEPLYQRALRIWEKALGPEHPSTATALNNLAVLYYARAQPEKAEVFFQRGLENLVNQSERYFPYMSEKDRLAFLDTVSDNFPGYASFCFSYGIRNPVLAARLYDSLLWRKGLVASGMAALRSQILSSGDRQALALLDQLNAKRTLLANFLNQQPKDRAEWRKTSEQLGREADEIERELARTTSAWAEQKRLTRATWRDVQKALAKDDAAVEVVRFRFHDGRRWTDKTYYAALVITSETTAAPALLPLGEAEKLEGEPLEEYRWRVATRDKPDEESVGRTGAALYNVFWKPLETALAGKKRIYLSPDGALNQVSLGVVLAEDGRLLMEDRDLRLVSSTRDILRQRQGPAAGSAVLIGNPNFNLSEAQQRSAARALRPAKESEVLLAAAIGGRRSGEQRGRALEPLPGTKAELQSIQALLGKKGWRVEVYDGDNALEERVKNVSNPRVLHVATHGFFFRNQEFAPRPLGTDRPSGREDPMLRAGLYFAGANRALTGGGAAADLDDGVLTAFEATGLNLHGTELVVLSACGTGLGRVESGEGVFGLRRALEMAGAEAVLMSLWSVPDQETQELMGLFYEKWLAGKEKHAALREAQLEMRQKVKERYGEDLPFYWGAFVLVGK
jgi:tetratricopeptide (TPR) repeat protein